MYVFLLFEIFLLTVCFYALSALEGASRTLVPLACLFCLFWVERLDGQRRREEEDRKRALRFKLVKHREKMLNAQRVAQAPSPEEQWDETAQPGEREPAKPFG